MEASHDNESIDPLLLRQAVEALIFAADEPLTAREIASVVADVTGVEAPTPKQIEEVVEDLNASYEQAQRAVRIQRWGGGYRMATEPELAAFVQALLNPQRSRKLSRTLLETLAILAYQQPVTKPEIDAVRGVDSDYAIRRLLELGLVDVVGRSESLGRPLLYGTTPRFLEVFGLESLEHLPRLREVEQILGDPAFSEERAELLMLKQSAPEMPTNGEAPADDEASDDDDT